MSTYPENGDVNPEQIHGFLRMVRQLGPYADGPLGTDAVEISPQDRRPGPYATSLLISEPPGSRPPVSRRYPESLGSVDSFYPSVFSQSDGESLYTPSIMPPATGAESGNQRPPVPQPPSLMNAQIRCECTIYTGCLEAFVLDDVSEYVEHVDLVHLKGNFPKYCICCFCGKEFAARSNEYKTKRSNYEARIFHICSHLRQGSTSREIFRDLHFLKHIYSHGLIDGEIYRALSPQYAGPRQRNDSYAVPSSRNMSVEIRTRPAGRPESRRLDAR